MFQSERSEMLDAYFDFSDDKSDRSEPSICGLFDFIVLSTISRSESKLPFSVLFCGVETLTECDELLAKLSEDSDFYSEHDC